jgi:hypothetical protein
MVRRSDIDWFHHHCRKVRQTGIDVFIITAGWYGHSAMMVPLLQPDRTPARRRRFHHHRKMVRWPGDDGSIVPTRWYTGLASMVSSSPPDGRPGGVNGFIITAA